MAASQVFHGARAKLGIYDPATGQTRIIGLFNNVSFGLTYEVQEAYLIGKHGPAAITYVAQNPVNISASGYRVIEHGPHIEAGLPRLQDLLLHEYLELSILDRQSEALGKDGRVYKFHQVRPTGYSTTISARQQTELSMTFVGMLVDDESVTNTERPGATSLPG
jgi:hypothetical protein